MKRISFFLAILCTLLVAGLTAQAQTGVVYISSVGGLYQADTVNTGQDVVFHIAFNNNTGERVDVSNGFEISSPDGAVWNSVSIDTIPPNSIDGENWFVLFFDKAFSSAVQLNDLIYNPLGDTVGLLGAGTQSGTKRQFPVGLNQPVYDVTVHMSADKDANNLKHICIDSAFFPPGGTWVWVLRSGASVTPAWQGYQGAPTGCFVLYKVPDLMPIVLNTGASCTTPFVDPNISLSHCAAFTYNFDACDPDANGSPITFSSTGVGAIDPVTGVWSANTLAVGTHTVSVKAHASGAAVNMTVNATNAAPTINCPAGVTAVNVNVPDGSVIVTGADADGCDPKVWSIVSISPADASTATISAGGVVTFTPAAEGAYTVTVGLSDGIVTQPTTCTVSYMASALNFYGIMIQKTHNSLQGQFQKVDVRLLRIKEADGIGGFDLLIAYDNSAISLQGADVATSPLYNTCKWEYFTYRFGANGNCNGGCPSGLVRVVGIAETNNGAAHPVAGCPTGIPGDTGIVMFSLNFLVSNNRTFECQYVPIRFFWLDCGDNSVSSFDGSKLYIAAQVFDYAGTDEKPYVVDSNLATFPGYAGVPSGMCLGIQGKPAPLRNIDFYNGGIDIVCADSIDARGDINLNNVSYEIADAVMFTNYFVKGLGAFGTDPQRRQGSIAASDVNADGLALSVADLVYLIRVIVGDALPYPKTAPVQATYVNDNGTLSVDMPMGAAYVVIKGEVAPELLAQNMEMSYGVREGNTHVIIYPSFNATSTASFEGSFLNAKGEIVSIEMATAEGAPVVAKMVPASFGLAQNYPNPFNPTANISFSLPVASQYTLTVYNVTGQKVAEFSGAKEAGVHTITFNGDKMASGVYFYKLVAGDFSATKKMVLLK